MNKTKERIAEIIAQYHYAYEAWDASDGFPAMPRTIDYADQIISALTLPTVWIECGECQGTGELQISDGDMRSDLMTSLTPCTCKSGKREYRIWWEISCGHDIGHGCACGEVDKPLSCLDLGDHHVAHAYWAVIELREAHMIGNNKGKLVLREASDE